MRLRGLVVGSASANSQSDLKCMIITGSTEVLAPLEVTQQKAEEKISSSQISQLKELDLIL